MKKLAIAATAALLLGACSTTDTGANVDRALGIARTSLEVARIGAGVYAGLAPCSDTVRPPLCRSDAVNAEIVRALDVATVAIEAAASVYATAGSSAVDRDKAIQAATTAVSATLNILARYGLAGSHA